MGGELSWAAGYVRSQVARSSREGGRAPSLSLSLSLCFPFSQSKSVSLSHLSTNERGIEWTEEESSKAKLPHIPQHTVVKRCDNAN